MGDIIVAAFALMLVIEGILPFAAPRLWREAFRRVTELTDGQIRFAGLASMMVGLVVFLLGPEPCAAGCCPSTSRTSCPPRRAPSSGCAGPSSTSSSCHGYELVAPPLLEYVESLLSGTGQRPGSRHLQAGRPALRAA